MEKFFHSLFLGFSFGRVVMTTVKKSFSRNQKIEALVEKIVLEILKQEEFCQEQIELVDVEYVKERNWYLRVYIDKPTGIDIEDCQALSEVLNEKLDENNELQSELMSEYMLEVSSPGLDRVLKKPRDFLREKGKLIEISLYAPLDNFSEKKIEAKLLDYDDEKKKLKFLFHENEMTLPMEKIALVRLQVVF